MKGRYSEPEKIRIMKQLQLNGFNLMLTERQTGVSTVTLKKWRIKYPEAFNNHYTNKSLATIEYSAKVESEKVITHSSKLLKLALEQAERVLEYETDLSKIASFIRAIHPLAKNMAEIDSTNGYDKVASLTQTLAKMAMLKSGNVEDVTPQEPLV